MNRKKLSIDIEKIINAVPRKSNRHETRTGKTRNIEKTII